jgi:hypothetical protein
MRGMDLITWSDLPASVCRREYPRILYAIEDMFRVLNTIPYVMSTESNEDRIEEDFRQLIID